MSGDEALRERISHSAQRTAVDAITARIFRFVIEVEPFVGQLSPDGFGRELKEYGKKGFYRLSRRVSLDPDECA